MVTRDVVVGAIANYEWHHIEPWVISLEQSGYTGQKAMIVNNVGPDLVKRLTAHGFYIKHVARHEKFFHLARFFFLWELLSEMEFRYAIITDARDLIFQTNPSKWLEDHLPPFRLNVGSECLAYKDESWGNENMLSAFGPGVHAWMKDKTIYNAGTIAGEAGVIRDLSLSIYLMGCEKASHFPTDQAALNVLIQLSPWKEITRFNSMGEGWACQAGTVAAEPEKMKKLRPVLKELEPVLGPDGAVYPAAGNSSPFCIVHQYDRNPAWNSSIRRRYCDGKF